MAVNIGAVLSQSNAGTDPSEIRRYAVDVEAAGFKHLMAYDHVLGATPERLGPGPFGSFPGPPYTHENTFQEVLTLFSHLSAVTSTIEFVSSVLILPQRQAQLVAKQIATLDLLSGGRFRPAVGTGWNWAETESMGVPWSERTARLEEGLEVMRRLWTEPLVEFDGQFHHLRGVGINPLPSRPIPVMLGTGGSDAVLRRVVRIADGWMPLLVPGLDSISYRSAVRRLGQLCEEAGRDPATLPIFGRVYLGPGWQDWLIEAVEVGCNDIAIGFPPGPATLSDHLGRLVDTKPEIDRLIGAQAA